MQSSLSSPLAKRLRVPGYLLLGFMALLPLLDFSISAGPARPAQVAWRFSTFGQFSSSAAAPLIALLLLYAIAFACTDRRVLYVTAALSAVYAVLLLGAALSFPLDALEMRTRVPPAAQSRFMMASLAASIRLVAYAIGAVALTVSQARSARILKKISSQGNDADLKLPMRRRGLSGSTRPTPSATSMAPVSGDEGLDPEGVPAEE
jgi:hypothetical protein